MTLIIEDGTGYPDADSFETVEAADLFWSDRGIAAWAAALVPAKEAALRQAADYLNLAFRWPGQPRMTDQSLCWPRGMAYDRAGYAIANDIVPGPVKAASILLALEGLSRNLLATATSEPGLSSKAVKIGPISITRDFDTGSQPKGLARFPAVDAVISEIANTRAAGGIRVQRLIRG